MGTCEKCGKPTNEGYDVCYVCSRKPVNGGTINSDMLVQLIKISKQLELINNNLAHVRAAVCKDKNLATKLKKKVKETT